MVLARERVRERVFWPKAKYRPSTNPPVSATTGVARKSCQTRQLDIHPICAIPVGLSLAFGGALRAQRPLTNPPFRTNRGNSISVRPACVSCDTGGCRYRWACQRPKVRDTRWCDLPLQVSPQSCEPPARAAVHSALHAFMQTGCACHFWRRLEKQSEEQQVGRKYFTVRGNLTYCQLSSHFAF